MKRLDKFQDKQFGPVRIRPADLRQILAVLEGRKGLRIVADYIEFDSIDEFLSHFIDSIPNTLKVTASEPYLSVEFTRLRAQLYVSTSDIEASGLFAQLDAILRSCLRKPGFLFNTWSLVGIIVILQVLHALPISKPLGPIFIALYIAWGAWYVWVAFIQLRRHSYVQTNASASTSFWKRNSDNILIAVISAAIGTGFGVAATKITDGLSQKPPAGANTDSTGSSNAKENR